MEFAESPGSWRSFIISYTLLISTAWKQYPVVVMRGMSHLQFASGEPSDMIRKYDLKPEINDSMAHQATGSLLGKFVYLTLSNRSIAGEMLVAVETAGMFFQPLLDAYMLEGSHFLKPPCNSGPPTPLCQVGCPWTEKAVVNMAGLSKVDIKDTDTLHPAMDLFHHPKIFSSCPLPIVGCNITTSSVSENIYYRERTDSGLVPNSACEIRAKMKSRQSIMLASGMNHVDFNTTDAGISTNSCTSGHSTMQTREHKHASSPWEFLSTLVTIKSPGLHPVAIQADAGLKWKRHIGGQLHSIEN